MNGAELIFKTAAACGINICFANPGTTEIPLVAALDTIKSVKPVLGLFEGVCTGAADGYGRVTSTPAMTLLHLGPGLANGVANLHNARRAGTPVVNIIGEHTTWHRQNDPPLAMGIEDLAGTISGWQKTVGSTDSISRDMTDAVGAALSGRIATLIVPNDLQQADVSDRALPTLGPIFDAVDRAAVDEAAHALKNGRARALILGGRGCREDGLLAAARVKEATGCDLLSEGFPPYVERGAGLPQVDRIPYFPEAALSLLSKYEAVVLAGAHEPVTFFGYPGLPGRLLTEKQEKAVLCREGQDTIAALQLLAEILGAPRVSAMSKDAFAAFHRPDLPTGLLTPEKACSVIAALQPENAIIVDEGVTSSFAYWDLSFGAPRHAFMSVAGGAIGYGMPCAIGAALAAPGRKVINVQADGSALYTVQALWTQGREGLDITTLICSNRSYRILEMEFSRSGISAASPAARALTSLSSPEINWVEMAWGFGVPAVSVDTSEALAAEIRWSLSEGGPHLIEMRL